MSFRVWHERAKNFIAHGALTNSKRPQCFVEGVYPTHLTRGYKCYVHDSSGHKYIDFIGALGTAWFGYGNPKLAQLVSSAYTTGANLSLSSTLEVEVAEKFCSIFKLDLLRFCKTGTEACIAALRIARAYKQSLWGDPKDAKFKVLSQGYHGWADEFISLTPPANGIPPHTFIGTLKNDYSINDIADADAVIIEPVIVDDSPERIQWLTKLIDDCRKHHTIVIFDETITGIRYKNLGVYLNFQLEPDLVILGKAIGGGLPLSVVGGKRHIMEADYFISGSYFGDRVALSVARTALDLAQDNYSPNWLWDKAQNFINRFNKISPRLQMVGYPTRGVFQGNENYKALFWQQAIKSGILFGPSYFISPDLIPELDNVLSICEVIEIQLRGNTVKLEGEMPKSSIIQKMRNL